MIGIELSAEECAAVEAEAERRFAFHDGRGTDHTYEMGYRSVEWECSALGAEAAVAHYLGRDFKPRRNVVEDRAHGDVGEGIEVRWTRHPHGRLWVKERDPDGFLLFLVTGWFPSYTVVGWMPVSDARRKATHKSLAPGRPAADWVERSDVWEAA